MASEASWMTNTLTTTLPLPVAHLATLKNLVLPRLDSYLTVSWMSWM